MSQKSTIFFGNGIGMALDPEYFSLANAMNQVWNSSQHLDNNAKNLICSAVDGEDINSPPNSEYDLYKLQIALFSIDFLKTFEKPNCTWLNKDSRDITDAFRKFIHKVSIYFFNPNYKLPYDFSVSLVDHIKKTKPHILTTNYDGLLYNEFLGNNDIFKSWDGALVDGYAKKFQASNLNRHPGKHFGWYLHLHGSPLFINDDKID